MLIFDQIKKSDRPLWWLAILVLVGMGTLLGGLWYHQVYASSHYVESLKMQSFRRVRYPGLRGKILDRHGHALAENRPAYNVNLYLEELRGQFQQAYSLAIAGRRKLTVEEKSLIGLRVRYLVASNVVNHLGASMGQPLLLHEKRFQDHYATRKVVPLPVMEDLTPQQAAIFQEMPNKPPGLNLDMQPLRVYTNGPVAAHLIGYLLRAENVAEAGENEPDVEDSLPGLPDYEGKVGLEGAFDQELRGRSGIKSVLVNNLGYRQTETILSPAEPGHNIVTTIDLKLQRVAEQAFRQNGLSDKGAVVVMDPENGDVLALVSSPSFDPNAFIPRLSSDTWRVLNDPETNIMLNRATYGEYAPGSIFKIIVGLACLEAGDLDPNEIYKTQGFYQYGPRSKTIDTARPGDYNFHRALLKSSNEYFIHYGLKTGITNIARMARRFCLGQRTRLPLLQDESGFIPTLEWMQKRKERGSPLQPGDVGNISIGQGDLTVTTIQMAVMTCAVANGGKILWPRLVDRIETQTSAAEKTLKVFPGTQIRDELGANPRNLEIIRQAMLADVEDKEGTGVQAAVHGLRICGKTGTAEVKDGHILKWKNVWFVSFAPVEHPRYVVVVLVEGGKSGGGTCAPVARRIYEVIKQMEAKG